MMRAATQLQPRSIFLGWYVVSLLAWNWGLFALRAHHFIGPRGHIFGLFFSMVIVVGCALPVGWIWERRIEERHQREIAVLQQHRQEANLKLLVLQAQIEPHFLFNTLASLRALLREDVTQAEVMVDALVRHLRAVLPVMRSNTGASTLSDQVAICTSYLELMATRMEGRLTYPHRRAKHSDARALSAVDAPHSRGKCNQARDRAQGGRRPYWPRDPPAHGRRW
jgi:sensor histidine kinase YesM